MAGEKVQVKHWDGAAGKWTDVPVGINYDTAKQVAVNATALGDTTVVAAVAGKKIRVFAGLIMASINVDVAWADDTPNTMINAMSANARGGFSFNAFPGYAFQTASGQALLINLSTDSNVRG